MDDIMNTTEIIEKIIDIGEEQKKIFKNILAITKRQGSFIKQGKIEVIERQISGKQNLIHQIDQLHAKVHPLLDQLKEIHGINFKDEIDRVKNPELEELKNIRIEIRNIMKEIKKIDDENIGELKKDMGELGIKLKNMRKKKVVSNAYISNLKGNPTGAVFFDKKK